MSSDSIGGKASGAPPPTVLLGGVAVNAIAIGTLAWGVAYPDAALCPSAAQCAEMVRDGMAIRPEDDAVQVFDCADTYCPNPPGDEGYMETILAREVGRNPRALIVTKGGMKRVGSTSSDWRPLHASSDFSPDKLVQLAQSSCARISSATSRPVFLYQLHHMSEQLLLPVCLALSELRREQECFIHLGLCNVKDAQQLQAVINIVPIVSVQNKFNFWLSEPERQRQEALLDFCAARGICYMAYAPFGGLDSRNGKVNIATIDFPVLHDLAATKGCSVHALVLAWMRASWPKCCMPLVGSRSREHVQQLREAYGVSLTPDEVRSVSEGTRKKRSKRKV